MRAWAVSDLLPDWTITYHRGDDGTAALARLWHNPCVKHINLRTDDRRVVRQLENEHRCGPLDTRWDLDQ